MKSETKLLENTIVLSIGQLIPKVLSILMLPILTNQLTTSEYGVYDLIMTLSGFMVPIVTLQVHQAVFREVLSCKDIQRKRTIEHTAEIYVLLSGSVILCGVFFLLSAAGIARDVAIVIVTYMLCESVYMLNGQIVRGEGDNLAYSKGAILYAFVYTGSIGLLVGLEEVSIVTVIGAIVLGYIVAIIYYKVKVKRKNKYSECRYDFKELKSLLFFSAPIVPSAIALWMVNLSDRLIVTYFWGTSANGIYSVANKIPNVYNSAYSVFNMAWLESASKVADEGGMREYYSELFKKMFIFLTGIMLIIVAMLPIMFSILVDKQYDVAYFQIPILFWGTYFNSFVSFYGGVYFAIRRTKRASISSIVGAILNVIINIMFIKQLGIYAASLSTALSFGVIALYRAWDLKQYVELNCSKFEILKGLLAFCLATILISQRNMLCCCVVCIIAILYNVKNIALYREIINKLFRRK